jgi:hypothetical protein
MGSDLGEPDLWVSSTNTNAEPRDRLKTPFTQVRTCAFRWGGPDTTAAGYKVIVPRRPGLRRSVGVARGGSNRPGHRLESSSNQPRRLSPVLAGAQCIRHSTDLPRN